MSEELDTAITIAKRGPWYRCLECGNEGKPCDMLVGVREILVPGRVVPLRVQIPPRCWHCAKKES